MLTNCSQLKELETAQILDGKRNSFSILNTKTFVDLFVTFWTESVLIATGTSSSFKSIIFALCNLTSLQASS